jgi:hypothetical protein
MFDARAAALATSDFAFFPLPPHRPSRSARRLEGGRGAAYSLIRAIRRELARATDEPGLAFLPRITNYPY